MEAFLDQSGRCVPSNDEQGGGSKRIDWTFGGDRVGFVCDFIEMEHRFCVGKFGRIFDREQPVPPIFQQFDDALLADFGNCNHDICVREPIGMRPVAIDEFDFIRRYAKVLQQSCGCLVGARISGPHHDPLVGKLVNLPDF